MRSKPMLDHYRFNRSMTRLKQEIDFTRRLSRIASADIEFRIKQGKGGLICIRTTDEPLSLPRAINVSLSIPHLNIKEKKVVLTFTGSGWIKDEVELTLQYNNKSETLTYSNHMSHL